MPGGGAGIGGVVDVAGAGEGSGCPRAAASAVLGATAMAMYMTWGLSDGISHPSISSVISGVASDGRRGIKYHSPISSGCFLFFSPNGR